VEMALLICCESPSHVLFLSSAFALIGWKYVWCCVRVLKLDLFVFWRFLLRSVASGDGLGFPFWD
jgi:hypothetical protein